MKAEEIRHLPIGIRVRGKLREGTIAQSMRYGKGIRLDKWDYLFDDDLHGFNGRSDENIEGLVTEVITAF